MRNNFKQSDKALLEYLIKLNQEDLHSLIYSYLSNYYKNIKSEKSYLYAEGNIPIALVAHLDIVWDNQPSLVFYDQEKEVMWSPSGLGADDRAGVFSIIKIVSHGFRPHIIFTHDEEIGGLGAEDLSKQDCPFKDLRYIIELDRQGAKDCVFYRCGNTDFFEYVESFGFEFNTGSFSDISFLCPAWNIAGVNLSVGYINEHTPQEHLFCRCMLDTIEKVENMLSEEDIPSFKYKGSIGVAEAAVCDNCHKIFNSEVDGIRIVGNSGSSYYCNDCLSKICWCERCGKPYVINSEKQDSGIFCPSCYRLIKQEGFYDF